MQFFVTLFSPKPFYQHHKRLRLLSAGVCILQSCVVSVTQADETTEADIVSDHGTVVKFIESLPPAPPQRAALTEEEAKTKRDQLLTVLETAPPAISTQIAPVSPALAATPDESLRSALTRLKLPLPLPNSRIVITKTARKLELFSGDKLIKTYRVALGNQPQGHKQNQGDGRTPEGQFYICTRNAKDSAFHIFLGLSYPALPDATRAVNQKIISWRDYQVIRQRLASRGAPLWETRLGGWVGIHGGTDDAFAKRKKQERGSNDWTAGCIAVTNKEIAEIHAATIMGTPVLIQP